MIEASERKSILQILFRGGWANALLEFSIVQFHLIALPYLAFSFMAGRFLWFFWPIEYAYTIGLQNLTGKEITGAAAVMLIWAIFTGFGLLWLWGSGHDPD